MLNTGEFVGASKKCGCFYTADGKQQKTCTRHKAYRKRLIRDTITLGTIGSVAGSVALLLYYIL